MPSASASEIRRWAGVHNSYGLHPMLVHGVTPAGCSCGDSSCRTPGKHPTGRWELDQALHDKRISEVTRDGMFNLGLRTGRAGPPAGGQVSPRRAQRHEECAKLVAVHRHFDRPSILAGDGRNAEGVFRGMNLEIGALRHDGSEVSPHGRHLAPIVDDEMRARRVIVVFQEGNLRLARHRRASRRGNQQARHRRASWRRTPCPLPRWSSATPQNRAAPTACPSLRGSP